MYDIQKTRILKNLDIDVIEILKENDCFVAGGCIVSVFNNMPINDYDIYCKNIDKTQKLVEQLETIGFELKVTSHNAYSLVRKSNKEKKHKKLKIQIIKYKKFCNRNIYKTFNYFDFHCCMGAYNFKEEKFYLDRYFLIDNIEKRLRFNPGTEYPICSLYRTIKYQKKGYFLPGIEIIKIALAINNLKMNTYKDLKEQLMGIDTLFLMPLTEKLLNDENEEYDFGKFKDELANFYADYYESIIDKTFNNESECYLEDEVEE